jgi:hypothetical protein
LLLKTPRPKAHDGGHEKPYPCPTVAWGREPAPPAQPRKPRAGNDPAQNGLDLPGWLPAEALPPNVRPAAATIAAAYRRFVRDAPGELERTVSTR